MTRLLLAISLVLIAAATMLAQTNTNLGIQGTVTNSFGTPVSGNQKVKFTLYRAGQPIWTENQLISFEDGLFNASLGASVSIDSVRFRAPLELGIQIGSDPEISPRSTLDATAFARALPWLYTYWNENTVRDGVNVIGGSEYNVVEDWIVASTISGGGTSSEPNALGSDGTTVSGGWGNSAMAGGATVGGGLGNEASGGKATVSGGGDNIAGGFLSFIGGGFGNQAMGWYATIPGGQYNEALEDYSFAVGQKAQAKHQGAFVWADHPSAVGVPFASTGMNQFLIRAAGGVGIGTNNPGSHDLAVVGEMSTGISGATLDVENFSTGNGIAAHLETNGTDATLVIDQDGTGDHIKTFDNGNLRFRVSDAGNVTADGTITGGGADLAEAIAVEGSLEVYEPGDVLVVSETDDRTVKRSQRPYAKSVLGVYATRPGVLLTELGSDEDMEERVPLAVIGIVPVKISLENGPIRRGDLLVTSSTTGHAMKASPVIIGEVEIYPPGTILGKALQAFDGPEAGLIDVFVNVR